MVYLVTGPVGSGKTTRLLQWLDGVAADTTVYCGGIAAPVRDGHRYLRRVPDGEERLLDAAAEVTEGYLVKIGHHVFDRRIFEWGRRHLDASLAALLDDGHDAVRRFLVIDEIGPLELTSRGLGQTVVDVFARYADSEEFDVIMVVRDYLVEDIVDTYGLDPNNITTDLP